LTSSATAGAGARAQAARAPRRLPAVTLIVILPAARPRYAQAARAQSPPELVPRLRYHDQEQERWAPVPLDDRVQQAITGQQRPTLGRWPRRRLAAFPYFGQRGSTASRSAALPGRAQEAGRKIPDHHTQPGLAPSHYRTAPSEISGPSDPGSAAVRSVRSGRADAARATRHPALRASAPTVLHGSVAGAAAPALTAPRPRPPEDSSVLCPDPRSSRLALRRCRRTGPGEDVPAGQNQARPLHV
jgi:hypothetical protein